VARVDVTEALAVRVVRSTVAAQVVRAVHSTVAALAVRVVRSTVAAQVAPAVHSTAARAVRAVMMPAHPEPLANTPWLP
jgi:hypothetical protein